jgi:Cd2+/Zn2+-exporting ATPase
MLTGDNERTAAAVAGAIGLSAHQARLLPADKVEAVMRLKERYGVVAMVGDGINDAPALAAADLGIAMGAAGSDTALETADGALMSDDLRALPGFFALGRRTLAIVKQNVGFSVAIKVLVLVAAVAGYANMWLAVFADTGVALLVIANGMRLLRPVRSGGRAVAGGLPVGREGEAGT